MGNWEPAAHTERGRIGNPPLKPPAPRFYSTGTDFLAHAGDVLTRNFQKQIRESAIWPQMVNSESSRPKRCSSSAKAN